MSAALLPCRRARRGSRPADPGSEAQAAEQRLGHVQSLGLAAAPAAFAMAQRARKPPRAVGPASPTQRPAWWRIIPMFRRNGVA
eukprot:12040732-Alexandrium_andersonii.AAC.1